MKKTDIYKICAYFLVCGFLGWIFETIFVLISTGKLTDRGFLFIGQSLSNYITFLKNISIFQKIPLVWGMPIIEIYGLGGMFICLVFKKWKHKPIKLFLIGITVLTLFELMASYLSQYFFHQITWDYSNEFLNFQGRICLRSSIAWGILSVISVKWFVPFIDRLYMKIQTRKNFKIIICILTVYSIICAFIRYVFDPSIMK